jgi:two-component system invasion response regulator UvrY
MRTTDSVLAPAQLMTRILLVDDHPVVRQGIRQILSGALSPAVVGEAGTAEEGLAEVRAADWDVLVLDISLPGPSGLDLLKDVRHERPDLPVLVLSIHPADQFARRAIHAGAAGYLTKDSPPTELIQAVNEVVAGRRYLNPSVIQELVLGLHAGHEARPHDALSDREYQVLRMLASGMTVSQVAARLSLSVKTVSTYRARVLEKMGMKTTAELMHYGIRHNLFDE